MWRVEISAHIDALERDGALLADAAEAAGLRAVIPGCPGWQVRDLVRHQAYVHHWAARHVRDRSPALLDDELTEADILGRGPADADLIAAYRDGHAALVAALRDADPDLECATFMPAPSPLAFWARRQAHETAIHRYDAQSAAGGGAPEPAAAFGPAFAADGVDELIMGFAARRRYRPGGGTLDGGERSLIVRAEDAEGRWRVRLADGGSTVSRTLGDPDSHPLNRDDPAADCALDGPAAGLYAFLWNRADAVRAGLTITGRPEILAVWNASVRVRW
jgi:uncharacterized protein (TIGR03083 family)